MNKIRVKIDKPIYLRLPILKISKIMFVSFGLIMLNKGMIIGKFMLQG